MQYSAATVPLRKQLYFSLVLLLFCCGPLNSQGFLQAHGHVITNGRGDTVLLRGIGLGGWMLQEGYMLRFQGEGQQRRIREKFTSVVGEEKVRQFYTAWLRNHMQKADVDSLAAWGFNSIRLPMHFALYTLPAEEEPVKGKDTWLEKGFALTDSLLSWCKVNHIYLILDLHAAPGGQGNDLNISDRDPARPSLWESEENRRKTIALWRRLAARYKDEPWIGAYDILNEPNWGFSDPKDKNGLKEQNNAPIRDLYIALTRAIREVDPKHLIVIEGNGWGNNYNGLFPLWDRNLVLSFHKYWNRNDQASIRHFVDLRNQYNVPLWLGETGENSNVWFTECIRLAESNGIGWSWWPLKKLGFNNPLQVQQPKGYQKLLDYFNGKAPKPGEEEAFATLMELAENTRIQNCLLHRDVIDAMFRQVYSAGAKPFKATVIGNRTNLLAVDYDLGRVGVAYFDRDTADYHISSGSGRAVWNTGRVYRNDGVDIEGEPGAYYVTNMEAGEWLRYTVDVAKAGNYGLVLVVQDTGGGGEIQVEANGAAYTISVAPGKAGWNALHIKDLPLRTGTNSLRVIASKGSFQFRELQFRRERVAKKQQRETSGRTAMATGR